MKQTILYSTLEPLLSELYFLNYKKYNRINDRLIVIENLPDDWNKDIGNDLKSNFRNTIKKYKIKNVLIDDSFINMFGSHAELINKTKHYILDEKYYVTCIDEQDSFFLGDYFNFLMDEIYYNKFNLIGGIKDKLVCNDQLDRFNKDFNLKHTSPLCTLHLPQFINNKLYSNVKNFNAMYCFLDHENEIYSFIKNLTNKGYFLRDYPFDTFQYINFQYYMTDYNKKLYEINEWNLYSNMCSAYQNINDDFKINSLTLHIYFSGLIQRLSLFHEREEEKFLERFAWFVRNTGEQGKFILSFLYYVTNNISFEYKKIYIKNFENIKDYLIINEKLMEKVLNLIV